MSATAERSRYPETEPTWDQLSIETPELVDIDMQVAGIGSRFVAVLVDYLLWFAAIVVLLILRAMLLPSLRSYAALPAKWVVALSIALPFALQFGYFTLFEAFNNGRTPGKMAAKIRVIQHTGRAIGILESITRNLIRFIDWLPGIYAVGVIAIFLNRRHQRLGDLAAGTLVVHDREQESPGWAESSTRMITAPNFAPPSPSLHPKPGATTLSATAIARLSPADLQVLEGFFARRLDMTIETRSALAGRIAQAIQAKMRTELPPDTSTEAFLETVAHQLRDLSRIR